MKLSRFQNFFPITDNNFLFFYFFKFTNYCNPFFYQCGKILNYLFLLFSLIPIYLISIKFFNKKISKLICILTILMPINTYVSYFLPEIMYYCAFWYFVYFLISLDSLKVRNIIFLSFVMSSLYFIRPHVNFIIPSILLILYFKNLYEHKIKSPLNIILLILFYLFFLLLGQFIFNDGFNFFGNRYEGFFGRFIFELFTYNKLLFFLKNFFINLYGHLTFLSFIFFIPILCLVNIFLLPKSFEFDFKIFLLFLIIVLFTLILVTTAFTAAIVDFGPYESIYRLHLRYYNFTFPIFIFLSFYSLKYISNSNNSFKIQFNKFFLASISLFVLGSLASFYLFSPFIAGPSDNPEYAFIRSRSVISFIFFINIFAFYFFYKSPRITINLFNYIVLPIFLVTTNINAANWQLKSHYNNLSNKLIYMENLGRDINKRISYDNQEKLLIATKNYESFLRVGFYIDNIKEYQHHILVDSITIPSSYKNSFILCIERCEINNDEYEIDKKYIDEIVLYRKIHDS